MKKMSFAFDRVRTAGAVAVAVDMNLLLRGHQKLVLLDASTWAINAGFGEFYWYRLGDFNGILEI
jgi:hypothetical protein